MQRERMEIGETMLRRRGDNQQCSLVRAAALALTTFTLAACFASFERPEVRLEGVRVGGIGLRGGTVYAQLHVVNPNGFALRAHGLTYDLDLAGTGSGDDWLPLAEGTFDERIDVPARDSAVVEIPIEFSYGDLSGALRSMLDRGTLDYRVSGSVRVTEPVGRTVPYRHTGTVSMSGVR
jgi:LEA14-like dessication related protein